MSGVNSWTGRVAITGVGLVTPVGLAAPAAAAAMRAGISRIADLPALTVANGRGEPVPMTGAEVPGLTGNRQGLPRLVRLAEQALDEAMAQAKVPAAARCALFLGTAAPMPGRMLSQGPRMVESLVRRLPGGARGFLCETGRAAALEALRTAAFELTRKDASIDVALAGGVDSLISPFALEFLQAQGRLREGRKSAGILPGESAGFFVLERFPDAARRGAVALALLEATAGAVEATPVGKPNRAVALGRVLRALAGAVAAPAPLIVSDLNGERHRAFEWMFASSRTPFYHGGMPHWLPSESVGDTGAASGAVGCAWAVLSLHKGYAPAPEAVVWGASDEGAREALVLKRAKGAT